MYTVANLGQQLLGEEGFMASVSELMGIDEAQVAALAEAGIYTVDQLLDSGATSSGRMRIADEAHLTDELVKRWVHQADLFRLEGMTSRLAAELQSIGVYTVPKLAYRTSDELHAELMAFANESNIPTRETLEELINEAKKMPKVVHH